jgi:hypothetical protein
VTDPNYQREHGSPAPPGQPGPVRQQAVPAPTGPRVIPPVPLAPRPAPAPTLVVAAAAQPVAYAPPPVAYAAPPVAYAPAPVAYAPAPVVQQQQQVAAQQQVVAQQQVAAPVPIAQIATPVLPPPPAKQQRKVKPPRKKSAPPTRTPVKHRASDLLERLDLTQVACWQIAIFAVAFSIRRPWPVIVVIALVAVSLLAMTTVRVRGRWLYELVALAYEYLLRARSFDLPGTEARGLALLNQLLPGTSIRTIETGHGSAMVLSQPRGLTAMIRPPNVSRELVTTFPAPASLLPSPDLATGVAAEFGLQIVYYSGTRLADPPRLWLAVHAERTADTPADDELALGLRNAMRRIRKALRRAGVETEPLADEAAFATVSSLAHVTGHRHEVRESWRFVSTGVVSQACFRLDGWESLDEAAARRLLDGLLVGAHRTAGVAITVTCHARTHLGAINSGALLRLAATTEGAVNATSSALNPLLHLAGIVMTRLDGEHASGLAASLPIGGFVS